MSKKTNLNRRKRRRLFEASPYCFFCERILEFEKSTLDHLIPRARGGKNTDDNLVLACVKCNHRKQDKLPTTEQLEKARARPPLPTVITVRLCCFTKKGKDSPHTEKCYQHWENIRKKKLLKANPELVNDISTIRKYGLEGYLPMAASISGRSLRQCCDTPRSEGHRESCHNYLSSHIIVKRKCCDTHRGENNPHLQNCKRLIETKRKCCDTQRGGNPHLLKCKELSVFCRIVARVIPA